MAVPAVFDTGVRPVFALPKLTIAAVGALLLLGLAIAERLVEGSGPRWGNALTVPVVVVLVWTGVSALASPDPSTSVLGTRESLNGAVTTAVLVLLFFAAAQAFDGTSVRTAVRALWFGGGGIVLAYGGLQLADRAAPAARLDPVDWVNPLGERAIWSTLGNPNDLAGFLAILLPLGLVVLLLERGPVLRAVTGVMLVALVAELVATTSRGAVLGAAAAAALLVAWLGGQIARRARAVGLGALAVVAAVALIVAGGLTERGLGRLARTGEGTTVGLRVELWGTAWRMAADNPLFGVGPDGFGRAFDAFRSDRFVRAYGADLLATDAHNVVLTALATQGFPGLLALGFLLGSAAALVVRAERRLVGESHALLVALGAALLAYVVQGLFNRQDVALDFCFWVLLGLVCSSASGPARPQEGGEGHDRGEGTHDQSDPGDRVPSAVPVV